MPEQTDAPDLSLQFLSFVRQQALSMRANDSVPATLEEWTSRRQALRSALIRSWGGFPSEDCPLEPRVIDVINRDGYRVEKIVFQTRPGVLMTANAWVPEGDERRPAVLCVHGHWRGAKQDPVVQSRCVGLAKLGFFVLSVDAFGAGERGIGKALGEYHGEMVAATLWPAGLALAGLQVYENMRAVDYLQSRPEVDPDHIGITGTSGGGNQTMYAGAIDDRFGCVVPTCSVGTYQAYLGAACCMCEVTPGALTFTEEWGVLALVAPRGLMVTNATRDAVQFSVDEARKSIAVAANVFRLYGKENSIRHTVVDSGHDYNQPMREAMYGWMTLHLKGEGDGSPIPEPEITTVDPESLRCFPGESRPDDFLTLPAFAAAEAKQALSRRPIPSHIEAWEAEEMTMRGMLPMVLGGFPKRSPLNLTSSNDPDVATTKLEFSPEPGITVTATYKPAGGGSEHLAVLLDLSTGRGAVEGELATSFSGAGWDVLTPDLRATGATAYKSDAIGRAPDHNTAEWSMWIGRPLLGQWVWDVTRLLDVITEHRDGLPRVTAVIGIGPASLIAICAAALDSRISQVATVDGISTFVSDHPYQNQRLGIMVPGLLNRVGDVPQLASLVAPRRLVIAAAAEQSELPGAEIIQRYAWTDSVYELVQSSPQFHAKANAKTLPDILASPAAGQK